ncbi:MAG: hypothetical protein ACYCOO_08945, partial [Chitinophagaceae bacterium]
MNTFKTKMDNFFLWFGDRPGKEKITIGGDEPGIHYTILFKGDKRVVDIHKTIELPNNKKQYEQILEIGFFTCLRFLLTFNNANHNTLSQFLFSNRINLGKLGHHKLILF